jgi:hypothetical protein
LDLKKYFSDEIKFLFEGFLSGAIKDHGIFGTSAHTYLGMFHSNILLWIALYGCKENAPQFI